MPLLLGVLLGVAGLAIVIMGKITLPGGRVIAGRPARKAAIAWLSFLPAAFFASFVMELFGLEMIVDRRLVHWILVMLCMFVGLGFLLPAWSSARPRRSPAARLKANVVNPFETILPAPAAAESPPPIGALEPDPSPMPVMGKPAKRSAPPEKNPFDFS